MYLTIEETLRLLLKPFLRGMNFLTHSILQLAPLEVYRPRITGGFAFPSESREPLAVEKLQMIHGFVGTAEEKFLFAAPRLIVQLVQRTEKNIVGPVRIVGWVKKYCLKSIGVSPHDCENLHFR